MLGRLPSLDQPPDLGLARNDQLKALGYLAAELSKRYGWNLASSVFIDIWDDALEDIRGRR